MASIFREGFDNVNDLGNASGKEGLQGEKRRVTLSYEDTLLFKMLWGVGINKNMLSTLVGWGHQ